MRKGAKNYYQRHKPDVLKANKKRYDARTPAQIEHKRIIHYEYQLKMKYGLSKEDIDKMLIEQNFACKICAEKFNQTPFVDHDHKTGKVRGLLCRICNLGLGWVEKMTVEKCIIYLK